MGGESRVREQASGKAPVIDQALLDACIHCGLCLPACPTYLATGRETESPRGRIYLLNLWQKKGEALAPRLIEHIDSCLGCLGCQTACPSGVEYGAILNQARPELVKKRSFLKRALSRLILGKLLPNYKSLIGLGKLLRIWQQLAGRAWLERLARIKFLPLIRKVVMLESYLPPISEFSPLPKQSWNVGKKEGTVQFFSGCVMDVLYGPANHAALRLLKAQGQIVEVPEQTCCGALAFHAGEVDIALKLARENIAAFEKKGGAVVVTSAGCGAMLKEYELLFEKDDDWRERAKEFASRVQDIAEFLNAHQFPEQVRQRARAAAPSVAYHAACHLAHAQKVRQAPEKLLGEMVKDVNASCLKSGKATIDLVPLMDAELCCGSAGTFNISHADLSGQILAAKMARLRESGAALVVTGNPGCLMQLSAGARLTQSPLRVMHLVELLDQVYDLQGEEI
jgi:glycolate oxidase iron-sulfur subunit